MKFLVELLQEALNLPDSVRKSKERKSKDPIVRKPEFDLTAHVISYEQIRKFKAHGIFVKRKIDVEEDLATMQLTVANGHVYNLTVTYDKRPESSTFLSVRIDGEPYGMTDNNPQGMVVTTIAEFKQILVGLIKKSRKERKVLVRS